jgi:hypothetical protein
MVLHRHADPAAFNARAEPFLLADEAAHILPLAIAATLIRQPGYFPGTPYLAMVVAAAPMTLPHNLILFAP